MSDQSWMDTATAIGRRIASDGLWGGNLCTWSVQAPHPNPERDGPIARPAGPDLYQGTAGIGWFLAELAVRIGDAELERTAIGALRHALFAAAEREREAPWEGARARSEEAVLFGLHSGLLGVAWTGRRVGGLLEAEEITDAAVELQVALGERLARRLTDLGADIPAAGSTGVASALLLLAEVRSGAETAEADALARVLAEDLADRLLEDVGAGSGTPPRTGPAVIDWVTGRGHGRLGLGLALLELARATGRDDLATAGHVLAEVETRRGADPAGDAAGLPGVWCAGVGAGGLVGLRLWELGGARRHRLEVEEVIETVLERFREAPGVSSSCLCHGLAGDVELLVHAAARLGRPELHALAHDILGRALATHGPGPWPGSAPASTPGASADPSLMRGDAGIGLTLLRVAASKDAASKEGADGEPGDPAWEAVPPSPLALYPRGSRAGVDVRRRDEPGEPDGEERTASRRGVAAAVRLAPRVA